MIYLINDREVSKDYFYFLLNLCVFSLFCILQIKNESEESRKINNQLLAGYVKKVVNVKFQIIYLLKEVF